MAAVTREGHHPQHGSHAKIPASQVAVQAGDGESTHGPGRMEDGRSIYACGPF